MIGAKASKSIRLSYNLIPMTEVTVEQRGGYAYYTVFKSGTPDGGTYVGRIPLNRGPQRAMIAGVMFDIQGGGYDRDIATEERTLVAQANR